ncbi:uncharacterized protein LOC118770612 [Megalops cyprinoides]|uniref:uncharacterized protein LOC118770612 n=1 Tax=Megalops cyprinoides TaxID=118141 RepID=UPI001863C8CC|nr:uncharacterized protein LOC118770612 [Megalops cyprinoides]XP_036374267.1 uncharacterized protein LOC118770612 [Megalops cyprinoides]XP_036374268.1 uncharacterized protein LOC118770612 [Megalops cyprinoides]
MEDELRELRELVRQLQADKEHLLQERASAQAPAAVAPMPGSSSYHAPSSSNPVTSSERLLYLPRERKCPVFRGRAGIGIDEWIEKVHASIRAGHLGPLDQAYFIFNHLDGEAKDEIRYRSRAEREDPQRILSILKELYGCSNSYVALKESFFSRKQLDGESLQEYSHALFSAVPLSDVQFVEHVLDPGLRRELKRLVRQTPGLSMLEVRAIRWEQEGRPSDYARGRSYSVPSLCAVQCSRVQQNSHPPSVNPAASEMAELRAMLLKQQEQINQLTTSLTSLQVPAHYPRPGRPNSVICRRCQRRSHYARECDNERVAPARNRVPSPQGQTNYLCFSAGGKLAPSNVQSHTLEGDMTGSHDQRPISNTVSSIVGSCPKVAVRVGGVVVNCLLDTGSMVSTMVESFF